MIEIIEGNSYVASRIRTGNSKIGPYEVLIVQNPGPRQPSLGISVLNIPSGVGINGGFRVEHIHSVSVRNWQDGNGEWHKGGSVTVRAEVVPTGEFVEPGKWHPKKPRKAPTTELPSLEDLFK